MANNTQTITSTTFVGKALTQAIKNQYPELDFVYSDNLNDPFSETVNRDDKNINPQKNSNFPLLAYNRSVMRRSVLGSRGVRFSAYAPIPTINPPNNQNLKYRTTHCEFDFNFSLIDKDVATIESFEIDYMSREGLGRITEIEVDFSSANLGFLKYYVVWNGLLGNLSLNTVTSEFVSISGSATVTGFFVSLIGPVPLISTINATILKQYDDNPQPTPSDGVVLDTLQIT